MAKVICTLPNASSEINGIRFVSHKLGMISEDIDDAVAKQLSSIGGYHLHDPKSGGIVAGPDRTNDSVRQESGPKPTPESLATSATSLSGEDHAKLLDLLMEQEASRKADLKAHADNMSAGVKDKAAATDKTKGTGKAEPNF